MTSKVYLTSRQLAGGGGEGVCGDAVAGPGRGVCARGLGHVLVLRSPLRAVLVVVQNIQHGLWVLLLHLLGDVGGHQEPRPGLGQPGELSGVIVKPNMDNMGELSRIGYVRLLIAVLPFLQFTLAVLDLLLGLLRQRPEVHREAHGEVPPVGCQP